MPFFTDQLQRTIELDKPPQKIVSLVPSLTELLYDLGLENEVVGITKFCVHPAHWFNNKTRIGGTKQLHLEKIKLLQPNLILANKEENVKEQIEELGTYFPVWISDVHHLESAKEMITEVGKMTAKAEKANEIVSTINQMFADLLSNELHPKLQAAYLIWQHPYMTIGGDTFISHMMPYAGVENIFVHTRRYPETSIAQLQEVGCTLLLLSSEPFPFKEKQKQELQHLLPHTRILLVDGEMFSWYGSRLLKAPAYFKELRKRVYQG